MFRSRQIRKNTAASSGRNSIGGKSNRPRRGAIASTAWNIFAWNGVDTLTTYEHVRCILLCNLLHPFASVLPRCIIERLQRLVGGHGFYVARRQAA